MQKNIYYYSGIIGLILTLLSLIIPPQLVRAEGIGNGHISPVLPEVAPPLPPDSPATTVTTFTNSNPVTIPSGPDTITSTITVSGVDSYLWDLDVETFIRHTWVEDLDITLSSPAGKVVTLTSNNGDSNDDVFNGTFWDDSADDPVTDHAFAYNAVASPLSPEEPLAAFIGEDPNGDWVLTINDVFEFDGGSLDSWELSFTTVDGIEPVQTAVTFTNSRRVIIPSGPDTVTSTITVSDVETYLWDLDVETFIRHTWVEDLDITITSPAGTIVTLTTDNGSGHDDVFNGTFWDDNADDPVTDHTYINNVLASPLSPEEPLAAFIGEDPNGDWVLTIHDDFEADNGSLDRWSLFVYATQIETDDPLLDSATLPASGFAPNVVTDLPIQPVEKTYLDSALTLEIPKISVNTDIVGIPQNAGTWDVSWLGSQAGWLEGSAFPTWAGNSLITGHAVNANGKSEPFADLGSMSWGDQIVIHAYGQAYIYEVRMVNRWVDPNDNSVLTQHEELPWLTLITCNGYDAQTGVYRWRTVVQAVQVSVVDEN